MNCLDELPDTKGKAMMLTWRTITLRCYELKRPVVLCSSYEISLFLFSYWRNSARYWMLGQPEYHFQKRWNIEEIGRPSLSWNANALRDNLNFFSELNQTEWISVLPIFTCHPCSCCSVHASNSAHTIFPCLLLALVFIIPTTENFDSELKPATAALSPGFRETSFPMLQ